MRNLRCSLLVLAYISALCVMRAGFAADCIAPNAEVVNGVILRAAPTTASTNLGKLLPGNDLPLVASVPNWFETRLPGNQPAFASKRWVVVGACGQEVQPATPQPPAGAAAFTVDAFDVGTGLSVLVRGADFTVLYDAGSNDDAATGSNNRVVAYLKMMQPQITTLDHVILSHPHKDHLELLPDVIGQFSPRDVWDSGSRGNMTCGYWAFLQAVAANSSIRYHTVTQADGNENVSLASDQCPSAQVRNATLSHSARIESAPITLGANASMQFLHADGTSHSSNPNRNSLVVLFTLGSRRVLFMGDAEAGERAAPSTPPSASSIEGKLLQCCSQDLTADVLIVGHHGSMTSSRNAFLDAVGASIFVISSGPHPYRGVVLPDAMITQNLAARGQVFLTNVDDVACANSPAKVGSDADEKPGGCDLVRVAIPMAGAISVVNERTHD